MSNLLKNKINFNNISVVVQGNILGVSKVKTKDRITYNGLKSIRKHLPKAKIILSTWECSDVTDLDYDELIFNKDPGPIYNMHLSTSKKFPKNIANNINRQIVSTLSGLRKVKTKYAIKLRSDFSLTGTNFIKIFQKYNSYDHNNYKKNWKIFKNRILILDLYTRNPKKTNSILNFVYHPSDLFQLGLTDDLLNFWDIHLMDKKTAQYFENKEADKKNFLDFATRFCSEQYLWISVMKKNNIKFKPLNAYYEKNSKQKKDTEYSFLNNFIIFEYMLSNLYNSKFNQLPYDYSSCYNFYEWIKLYKHQNKQKDKIVLDYLKYNFFYRFIKFYKISNKKKCSLIFHNLKYKLKAFYSYTKRKFYILSKIHIKIKTFNNKKNTQ
jgi:hypothetical protein